MDRARRLTAVFRTDNVRFIGRESPRAVHSARASANLFAILGTRFARGRAFTDQETDVVVVSNEFWRDELAGNANVVGQTIRLAGGVKTVVGVLPPHFDFTGYGTN